ncbi:MAG: hypothetical protein ABIH18_02370 [Candidatus Omnitrophota bacterium]
MKAKLFFALLMVFFLLFLNSQYGFSQNSDLQEAEIKDEAAVAGFEETETKWLWGSVVLVDKGNNEIMLKYMDYDTDTEKEIKMKVDDKTVYEEIDSLGDVKPNDILSIDYIVSPEGQNVASVIILEKAE